MVEKTGLNTSCSCKDLDCKDGEVCSLVLTSFRKIANELYKQYKHAKLVVLKKIKKSKNPVLVVKKDGRSSNKPAGRELKAREMAYLYKRDYCPQTKGQECAMKLMRPDIKKLSGYNVGMALPYNHCKHLCCGRGHTKKNTLQTLKCTCRYSNSRRDVVCKSCLVLAVYSYCN